VTAITTREWPLLIAGEHLATGTTRSIYSPWDGSEVATVSVGGRAEALRAVDAAADAMKEGLATHERAAILDRAALGVEDRADELATIMALEIGKPVTAAHVEIGRCVETLRFSAAAARALSGRVIQMDAHRAGPNHLGFTLRVPIGVVAAITPFNFPLNLAAHKVGPALAAGCATVLKPPSGAPLTNLVLTEILWDAGLPPGWLSVVVGNSAEIGDVFVEDDRVRAITFTGSSKVGWDLRARAPRKRVALELGNSTPLIVCADADLEAAAQVAAATGFGFAGQSCISVQRVLVEESAADQFTDLLTARASATRLGDPLDPDTVVGPVINAAERDRVVHALDAARSSGARELAGGRGEHDHLMPTVLTDVPRDADAYCKELFGPVVVVNRFARFEDALEMANETPYGLQAGIYTRDINRALTAAAKLEFGGVTINETPSFRVDQMPYGGVKESGNTREGPFDTVLELTEERMVVVRTGQ
jgi:acyl-CoA reductase-like NAD-dependent aldehyde dehydrogenase